MTYHHDEENDPVLSSRGEWGALNGMLGKVERNMPRPARMYIVSKLLGREVGSSKEMTQAEWKAIVPRAYDPELMKLNKWKVMSSFLNELHGLHREYLEQVEGQMTLPFEEEGQIVTVTATSKDDHVHEVVLYDELPDDE